MGRIRLCASAGLVCFFCVAAAFSQQDQAAFSASSGGASAVAAVPRRTKLGISWVWRRWIVT